MTFREKGGDAEIHGMNRQEISEDSLSVTQVGKIEKGNTEFNTLLKEIQDFTEKRLEKTVIQMLGNISSYVFSIYFNLTLLLTIGEKDSKVKVIETLLKKYLNSLKKIQGKTNEYKKLRKKKEKSEKLTKISNSIQALFEDIKSELEDRNGVIAELKSATKDIALKTLKSVAEVVPAK